MSDSDRSPAIFLMGPTAAGKTDLAILLGAHLPLEIVSVDSAQVYRGMDIGTAKPDAATLARAPHRLIDIVEPVDAYSAEDFRTDALREMQAIRAAGRIPLLVGGTGLYFRALEHGLARMPAADPQVRAALAAEIAAVGPAALHRRLAGVDPLSAQRIHPHDPQRIVRALEVHALTGRPISTLQAAESDAEFAYRPLRIVIAPADRAVLHARIAARFRRMAAGGLLDELRGLRRRWPQLHADLPSMRSVGYRQAWTHLDGGYDFDAFVERGIIATRQLAKRQITWFRHQADARWLDPTRPETAARLRETVRAFLDAG